jgi:prophage tail gpP-like protein
MQIKVNGKLYNFFNEVVISTTLDTIASIFTFTAFYDRTNPDHQVLFKPLSYYKAEFFSNEGALIMTGTITHYSFKSSASIHTVQLSGYSLPGVLDDCQIPYSSYPLQQDNLTLQEIVANLIKPFHLTVITYSDVVKESTQIIAKTVAKVDETIKDYICKVANQKNVVVSHDIHGNVILFRPDVTLPPKLLLTGTNTLDMSLDIDGTKLHSTITTLRQPSRGTGHNDITDDNYEPPEGNIPGLTDNKKGKVFKISSIDTVTNPLVGTFRPYVHRLTKLSFYDTHRASLNMRAAELKNIKVLFSLDHWEPVSVGDVIQVLNPEIFINNTATMILESTSIQQSGERQTMSGTLVLAETFNGDEPQNIFG